MGQGASKFDHYGPSRGENGDVAVDEIPGLRQGYIATGVLAVLSFVSCVLLFLFITLRLVQWRLTGGRPGRKGTPSVRQDEDSLDFGDASISGAPIDGAVGGHGGLSARRAEQQAHVPNIRARGGRGHINPLLVFIYMLLAADILQSGSMILNLVWLRRGGIQVRSDTCRAQGWLRSQGDIACGLFAACIAVHTYLTVVKGRWTGYGSVIIAAAAVWVFSTLIVGAGVWATHDGAGRGGYWSRVSTWCWVSNEFPMYRMWTHFAWVLSAIATVIIMYVAIALSVTCGGRGRKMSLRLRDPRDAGHHPAFLVYPLLFLICNVPMALGPMILYSGTYIDIGYFMWAGAMVASNGWMDVVLWSTTMIALAPKDLSDAGLDQFAFVPTQRERQYGNMVWIQGGKSKGDGGGGGGNDSGPGPWWRLRADSNPAISQFRDSKGEVDRHNGMAGGGGGHEPAIQMETVTSVMVEESTGKDVKSPGATRASHDTPSSFSSRY